MSELATNILTFSVPSIIAGIFLLLSTRKKNNDLLSEEEEESVGADGSRHIKKKKIYK